MKETTMQKAYSTVIAFLEKHRKSKKISAKQWNELHNSLAFIGFSQENIDAISLWTAMNLDQHQPGKVKWRVLHQAESQFIDKDAHGKLLEAQLLGMLSVRQLERVLEELVSREFQEVAPDHIHNVLAQAWSKNIQGVRNMRVN
ncbi:MAG: DUF494 domain-containing protein [Fibrobacter sp.]|nr:DUF494 domain-containing protein [Fibrobacter sp.]